MCAYYMYLTILKASKEYTGGMWRFYNATYRQRAAATGTRQWSAVDLALYSQCFTGRARKTMACVDCGSLKHEASSCPRKAKKPAQEQSFNTRAPKRPGKGPCWNFNEGQCSARDCSFPHICFRCQDEHPFTECPRRRKYKPSLPRAK